MAKTIQQLYLRRETEPDIFGLIDRLASLTGVLPTTALKVFLRRSLPNFIKSEQQHFTQSNRQKQVKN